MHSCIAALRSLLQATWPLQRVLLSVAPVLTHAAASAAVPATATGPSVPFKLRIVGGLGAISQYTREEQPFWTRALERLSAGRYDAEIVPFDRVGVPGPEMLRLLQLGVVPCGTVLMSSFTAQHPEYPAPDLAGLNPDVATLKLTLAAFRPYLEKALREQHGIEALAIYVYPAQVVFCKRPLQSLSELAGRRTRVGSSTQADFVGALGSVPVLTGFSEIVPRLTAGSAECAITRSMSGDTLGLYLLTTHLHARPVTWGSAVFGANRAARQALRTLLRKALPRLESAIREESERDTLEGMACNREASSCASGRKGSMTVVPVSPKDEVRRQEMLLSTIFARWVELCGALCAQVWNQTTGPARGLVVSAPK